MGRMTDLTRKATWKDWTRLWLKGLVIILILWLVGFLLLNGYRPYLTGLTNPGRWNVA